MSATIDLLQSCTQRGKSIELSPEQAFEILRILNDLDAVVHRYEESQNLLTQKYADLVGQLRIAKHDCKQYRRTLRKIIKRA